MELPETAEATIEFVKGSRTCAHRHLGAGQFEADGSEPLNLEPLQRRREMPRTLLGSTHRLTEYRSIDKLLASGEWTVQCAWV